MKNNLSYCKENVKKYANLIAFPVFLINYLIYSYETSFIIIMRPNAKNNYVKSCTIITNTVKPH